MRDGNIIFWLIPSDLQPLLKEYIQYIEQGLDVFGLAPNCKGMWEIQHCAFFTPALGRAKWSASHPCQFAFNDHIWCYRLQSNFCTIGRHSLLSCRRLLPCQTHRYTNTNIRTQQEGITLSSTEAALPDQPITAARLSRWREEATSTWICVTCFLHHHLMSWMLLLWTPKGSLGDSAVSSLSLSGKGGKSSDVLVNLMWFWPCIVVNMWK